MMNQASAEFSIRADAAELAARFTPEQLSALMGGLAQVLAAANVERPRLLTLSDDALKQLDIELASGYIAPSLQEEVARCLPVIRRAGLHNIAGHLQAALDAELEAALKGE